MENLSSQSSHRQQTRQVDFFLFLFFFYPTNIALQILPPDIWSLTPNNQNFWTVCMAAFRTVLEWILNSSFIASLAVKTWSARSEGWSPEKGSVLPHEVCRPGMLLMWHFAELSITPVCRIPHVPDSGLPPWMKNTMNWSQSYTRALVGCNSRDKVFEGSN